MAVVREKSGDVETLQTTFDVHPINLTDNFEVIGHAPKLMAIWLASF